MRRATRRALAGTGIVAGVLAVTVLWIVPAVVAGRLEATLRGAGFPEARVTGVRLGGGGLRIDLIELDAQGATRLAGVAARGGWDDLVRGRAAEIAVADATIAIVLARDGSAILAGRGFGGGGEGAWPAPDLPFDRVAVEAAHLALDTPFGEATVELQGASAAAADGALALRAAIDARHAAGDLLGQVEGTYGPGGLDARLALDRVSLRHPAATAEASGWAAAEMKPGAPAWLTGAVHVPAMTVGGLGFTAGELSFSGDATAMSLVARAEGPGGARLTVDGTAAWAAQDGAPPGKAGPGGDIVATVAVPNVRAAGLPADGAIDLRLALRGGTTPEGSWQAAGDFALGIVAATVPGLVSEASARMAGTLTVAPGALSLEGQQAWVLSGRLGPGLAAGVPALTGEPLTLTLAPVPAAPLRLAAGTAGGPHARLDGGFVLTRGEYALASGSVTGLAVALDGGLKVAVARLEAMAASQRAGGLDVGVPRLVASLEGTPDAWTATVDADVDVATAAPLAGAEGRGQVRFAGRVTRAEGEIQATPDTCASVVLESLRAGAAHLTEPLALCLAPLEGRPLLRLNQANVAALAGRSEAAPFAATVGMGDAPALARGTWPAMTIDALWAPGTPPAGSAAFAGGAIRTADVVVEAVEGRLETEADGGASLAVTARASHAADPPPIVPLRLEAALTRAEDGVVSGSATANDATGTIALDAVGRYDPALDVGYADLTLHPVAVVPGVREAVDLFPALAGLAEEASGTVAFEGRATWTPAGAASRGELMLKDVSVVADAVTVQAVNGVVVFDGLLPPAIPRGQSVAVGLVDVGVPLTDGVVGVGLDADGTVHVDRAEWKWVGGTVRTRPFAARRGGPLAVTLEAEGLDLGRLLDLADVDGLSGEGTLEGSLPLRLEGATILIEDGELAATGPGTLRYAPAAGTDPLGQAAGGTEVLLDALRNFRYESLVMSIDGVSGGESTVLLKVTGANPDFYGGYPVALNLNLSGALDTILRRGLAGYRVPEAVARELEAFGAEAQP